MQILNSQASFKRVNSRTIKAQPLAFAGKSSSTQPKTDVLFLSDIDGTWMHIDKTKTIDCETPKKKLNEGVKKLIDQAKEKGINLMLGYVTARPPSRLMSVGVPEPSFSIVQDGGEIFKGYPTEEKNKLSSWLTLNRNTGFDAKAIGKTFKELTKTPEFKNLSITTVGEIVKNQEADACEFMTPYCIKNESINRTAKEKLDNTPAHKTQQVKNFVKKLKSNLEKQGLTAGKNYAQIDPYPATLGPFVHINLASPKAHKGEAVKFLMKDINDKGGKLTPDHTIIACDGGNDIPMCTDDTHEDGDGRRLIIVGDNKEIRPKASRLLNNNIIMRPQNEISSLGVLAGLKLHLNDILNGIREQRGEAPLKEPAFKGNPLKNIFNKAS